VASDRVILGSLDDNPGHPQIAVIPDRKDDLGQPVNDVASGRTILENMSLVTDEKDNP